MRSCVPPAPRPPGASAGFSLSLVSGAQSLAARNSEQLQALGPSCPAEFLWPGWLRRLFPARSRVPATLGSQVSRTAFVFEFVNKEFLKCLYWLYRERKGEGQMTIGERETWMCRLRHVPCWRPARRCLTRWSSDSVRGPRSAPSHAAGRASLIFKPIAVTESSSIFYSPFFFFSCIFLIGVCNIFFFFNVILGE